MGFYALNSLKISVYSEWNRPKAHLCFMIETDCCIVSCSPPPVF